MVAEGPREAAQGNGDDFQEGLSCIETDCRSESARRRSDSANFNDDNVFLVPPVQREFRRSRLPLRQPPHPLE